MLSALLLAAGRSSRMGTQKLLLPFAGHTVIEQLVQEILRSRIDHLWVVTGHDEARIHQVLKDRPVSYVHNPDPARGMLSSVRCGIGAMPGTCKACMVVLGDQPSLTCVLIDILIKAFEATPKGLLVPCYEGRRGHPLLLSACYFEEIHHQFDHVGLRGLLQAHPDDLCEYPVASDQVLSDMDYPNDYLREINRL
ncbi:MAG: nucleotidyltransferase family protein [Phycisphaerae bacterium]|nr:nucleotidyltransferase family protein [Phycisphaerae bacterium]